MNCLPNILRSILRSQTNFLFSFHHILIHEGLNIVFGKMNLECILRSTVFYIREDDGLIHGIEFFGHVTTDSSTNRFRIGSTNNHVTSFGNILFTKSFDHIRLHKVISTSGTILDRTNDDSIDLVVIVKVTTRSRIIQRHRGIFTDRILCSIDQLILNVCIIFQSRILFFIQFIQELLLLFLDDGVGFQHSLIKGRTQTGNQLQSIEFKLLQILNQILCREFSFHDRRRDISSQFIPGVLSEYFVIVSTRDNIGDSIFNNELIEKKSTDRSLDIFCIDILTLLQSEESSEIKFRILGYKGNLTIDDLSHRRLCKGLGNERYTHIFLLHS